MINIPKIKVGIVAVSRDCFPESLSVNRRKALVEAYQAKYDAADIYECPICIVESEIHMVQALEDIKKAGCNALCVYLGNFGPEISETLLLHCEALSCNLHSAYHNMRLHVLEQDYLQFLLLLQRTSSVHQNALRAM